MKPKTRLHLVMLIDAWFPLKNGRPGIYGSSQVHVLNLRRRLVKNHRCQVELFFQSHPNPIISFFWPLIVIGQVYRYSRDHQIDIIHTHGLIATFAGKVLSTLLHLPQVVTIHHSHQLELKTNPLLHWLETRLYLKTRYQAQIAVSQNFLEYKNINSNLHYISNGVDLKKFSQVKTNKSEKPTLIWVGRVHARKGLDILKKAIVKIRKKIPDLQALLITGGELTQKELIHAYKRAHVFVLPSLSEGQPISLLEAWAARLPVVATDTGDSTFLVKNGVNGYLVEPGNVKQLANATIKILRAKVNDQRMAEAGYNLVKKDFSWHRTAQKTYAVYQSLVQ